MIVTRPFSPTDIPNVMSIVKDSLGESYPPSLYLTIHNLWPEGFLMAVEDGRPVGFVASVTIGSKIARVLMLAVLRTNRRRYLGRTLMRTLYEKCTLSGVDTVVLEVRKSNTEAMTFYKREGFETFGEVKNFYSNGEDAWKMMKVLGT
ncbi:MAG: GNAT family N-acetyltransferase [Candidatus Thermoplasmatota archaeon]|nr:GNAT family N-acetyltransferase [Candidatus Thermoplasmatota archaeon]